MALNSSLNISFIVLDSKKVSLFPRELFISYVLKSRDHSVRSIYSLMPACYWSMKSIYTLLLLPVVFLLKVSGIDLLSVLLRYYLKPSRLTSNLFAQALEVLQLSIFDHANKVSSFSPFSSRLSFLSANLSWYLRYYSLYSSLVLCIISSASRILSLRNTVAIIGDIFYAHETLFSILLLWPRSHKRIGFVSDSRINGLLFFTGIKNSELCFLKQLSDIRSPSGPYGSSIHDEILSSLSDTRLIPSDTRVMPKCSAFVIYPPCISDSFNFVNPSVYTSQVLWITDVFRCHKGRSLSIKFHPMAESYGDTLFWFNVIDYFAEKFKVDVSYLDVSLKLENVLDLGLLPISPKGTVGLELISLRVPSLVLGSNAWSQLFPHLLLSSRSAYLLAIQNCLVYGFDVTLVNYIPTRRDSAIASSLLARETSFYSCIDPHLLNRIPPIGAGSRHRLGFAAFASDRSLEDTVFSLLLDADPDGSLTYNQLSSTMNEFGHSL